ncbi:tRNA pseudouridine(55) synthase TruB [Mycoplasma simbae]|uniref:tRNA pseudouridine(55) synthase TruB n=1 Tax=Mycoplasma simbae TaxID=36744 RepID=UPI00049568F9|nr:tRNA pseudouridine(55) synthase TruB [Mycoplasma simbae]
MFYLLFKPKGISSFNCIKKFAREHGIKKIGHSGTLDPLASGLLLLATDEDTKLLDYIANKQKTYIAQIAFGQARSTYDSEGEIIEQSDNKITPSMLKEIEYWFLNQHTQLPPAFSAKKINGKRSYELARQNIKVELNQQKINISSVKIHNFDEPNQLLDVELTVSNGTYIRSLSHDLGHAFNTCSYMKELERTAISGFDKKNIVKDNYIAIINALSLFDMETISLKPEQVKVLQNGLTLDFALAPKTYLLTHQSDANTVIGIGIVENNMLKVKKLFGSRL